MSAKIGPRILWNKRKSILPWQYCSRLWTGWSNDGDNCAQNADLFYKTTQKNIVILVFLYTIYCKNWLNIEFWSLIMDSITNKLKTRTESENKRQVFTNNITNYESIESFNSHLSNGNFAKVN